MAHSTVTSLPTTNVTSRDPVTPEQYQMALDNVGLIGFCIEKFRVICNDDYTSDDAWQDGWFGLVRACQKFEVERGYKFSTYAVVQIRSAMQKGRGHHEGSNYRRGLRLGEEYERTLSLEAESDGPGAMALQDRIADPADVEADAIDSVSISMLRCYANGRCTDDLDRGIVEALFDPNNVMNQRELVDDVAERFEVAPNIVRRRIRRIKTDLVRYSDRSGLAATA